MDLKMKKMFTKALALLMVFCLVLPGTAMAATTYYIEVAISDELGRTVTGESSHYATRQEPLAAAVVDVIHTQYEQLETVFAKTGLRGIVDSGLEAFAGGKEAWGKYVDKYYDSVQEEFKDILKDVTSTYAKLTVDRANVITWQDEDGMTYTVTVTLRGYQAGTSDYGITVGEGRGTVALNRYRADAGKTVVISTNPEEGYIVNQVLAVRDNGASQKVEARSNLVYEFVMPAGDVTVHVTYMKAPMDPEKTGVADSLITDEKIAYMQGRPDGSFDPFETVSRAEVAMIFYRLLQSVETVDAAPFADVPADAWYAVAVNTLADLGVIQGMDADTFAPNIPITRAQFVAICSRFATIVLDGKTFEDVPTSHWAEDAISTAASIGWVNGVSSTLFAPERSITRAETAAMVNRVLGRIPDRAAIDGQDTAIYPDVASGHWAWYDINEASMGTLPR